MQGFLKRTRYQNKRGLCFSLLQMKVVDHLHLGIVMLVQQPREDT